MRTLARSGIALEAQLRAVAEVDFIVAKARFFARVADGLNVRQEKGLLRMVVDADGRVRAEEG